MRAPFRLVPSQHPCQHPIGAAARPLCAPGRGARRWRPVCPTSHAAWPPLLSGPCRCTRDACRLAVDACHRSLHHTQSRAEGGCEARASDAPSPVAQCSTQQHPPSPAPGSTAHRSPAAPAHAAGYRRFFNGVSWFCAPRGGAQMALHVKARARPSTVFASRARRPRVQGAARAPPPARRRAPAACT
jgi:hypothetical protein